MKEIPRRDADSGETNYIPSWLGTNDGRIEIFFVLKREGFKRFFVDLWTHRLLSVNDYYIYIHGPMIGTNLWRLRLRGWVVPTHGGGWWESR